MNADNWTICPKCNQEKEQNIEKLQDKANKAYGKVSQEQYLALLEQVGNLEGKELDRTLREDWELNTGKYGDFYVRYSCSCTKCKFNYEFKHDINILP